MTGFQLIFAQILRKMTLNSTLKESRLLLVLNRVALGIIFEHFISVVLSVNIDMFARFLICLILM